ncbi:MAG: pyruvate synthase subunit beta [Dehalococcoidia bacterium]|nr:pyruvate synthase subunit beta [Dehalococcoidia bacterium]
METLSIYAPKLVTTKNYFASGHRACSGCGEALAVRFVCKALGRNTIISMATGCMEIVSSPLPETAWEVPWIHTLFENASAVASGIESGLKSMKRKYGDSRDAKVVAMGGDGSTADIGLQALSGAMERGHDFIYVCYDNEAYMNTGIQRSSSTPYGASTTTAPSGKVSIGQHTQKKNMAAIAAAHNIPYVATTTSSHPFDIMAKIEKAKKIKGPSYIHILSVCPTGWRSPSNKTITVGRLAVETGFFPVYEIENGKYTLNFDYPKLRPVEDYLKTQGRFRHLTKENIAEIQEHVLAEYNKIKQLAGKKIR